MLELLASFQWPGPVSPFGHGCLVRFRLSAVLELLTVPSLYFLGKTESWIPFCSLINRGIGRVGGRETREGRDMEIYVYV